MTMEIPVATARAVKGILHLGYLVHTTVAVVNALVVCPDGRPWSVGVSNRDDIPRAGSWNGRGRPNAIFRMSLRAIAVTIATASTRALVQSNCPLRST